LKRMPSTPRASAVRGARPGNPGVSEPKSPSCYPNPSLVLRGSGGNLPIMTGDFTQLERAALADFAERFPADSPTIAAQLNGAVFCTRENTGAGFYTRFAVPRDAGSLSGDRMRSGCWARIDGLKNPFGFVLWLTDGYADCLEGFTVDDSTSDLDLAALNFTLPLEP
jgi:hypothetical protein